MCSQVRIQDFVKGGPAHEAESCRHSEAESHKWSKPSMARIHGPYGAFTLPDTDTDTETDSDTDTDTDKNCSIGYNSNLGLCQCLCSVNTSTQFYATDILSVSVLVSVSGTVNTPILPHSRKTFCFIIHYIALQLIFRYFMLLHPL